MLARPTPLLTRPTTASNYTLSALTVTVLLARVGHQAAVVLVVRDAIIVVIVITSIALAVVVRVLLGAVGHCGAVVPGILVSIPIPRVKEWDAGTLGPWEGTSCTAQLPPSQGLHTGLGHCHRRHPQSRDPHLSAMGTGVTVRAEDSEAVLPSKNSRP